MSDPRPRRHGQLLLLYDVVGDGRPAVPRRGLPLEHQGVGADLAARGVAGRVGTVRDLLNKNCRGVDYKMRTNLDPLPIETKKTIKENGTLTP